MSNQLIHDLIYFDFEKASSIWSQFQWGRVESMAITEDSSIERKIEGTAGVQDYVRATLNQGQGEKRSILETRILHHDLLNRVEAILSENDLVVDLFTKVSQDEDSADVVRSAIGNKPYIKVQGWSIIEDYRRILSIADNFPDILDFITKSQLETIKNSPEVAELDDQIKEARRSLNQIKDPNKKASVKFQLDNLDKVKQKLFENVKSSIDRKQLDAIKLFINTFMPNRINFRIYPLETCPSFQVLCNLKRESFVDQDLEHLLYGYGNRPNIKLTAFGLITSLPPNSGQVFDAMSEFKVKDLSEMNEQMSFEKVIREMFTAMDTFEGFLRFSRYPNITIHPIAVYRDFTHTQGHN